MHIDLWIHNAAQLVTCAGAGQPKRGPAMADVGLVRDGAVIVADSQIVAAGPTAELRTRYGDDLLRQAAETIDARGKVVCPGFVDAHTHVVYAGDRIDEFELRIRGATYVEIMRAGGGIVSTMRATRRATIEQLAAESSSRLDAMLSLGTTTAEVKTGYGLDTESELKMLRAISALDEAHPVDLVPTFLGAHAVPPEYAGRPDDYVDLVVREVLPEAAAWMRRSRFAARGQPVFCDVFCERGVFDLAQSRRVLEAGAALGFLLKLHADEFEPLGGVPLAVELGAASVDHLDVTPPADIARLAASGTIGVVLPVVNLNLGGAHFADARAMIDAGVALALATDMNPGSAPCPSLPLAMGVACRYQRMLPAEALNACTLNAAYAIGCGEQVGSIEAGKQADLLILDVPDYRHVAYQLGANPITQVIKQGWIVHHKGW